MRIFVINGSARSGKTTFGRFVGEILEKEGKHFLHGSSINPVKQYLRENGWDGKIWDGETKDSFWRKAMYECKCMMIGNDPHVFDKYAVYLVKELGFNGVLFYDIREPENIKQLVEYVSTNYPDIEIKTVFVERETGEIFDNYADSSQKNMEYDVYVNNNVGLEELWEASGLFVKDCIIGNGESKKEIDKEG